MGQFLRYNSSELTMVSGHFMSDLEAKKAYFARVRRSNYVASMRLEGMPVSESDASVKPASRKAVLRAHNCQVAS
jgi:YhfG